MWFFNGFFTGKRSFNYTNRDRLMFNAGRAYEAEQRGDKGTPREQVKAGLGLSTSHVGEPLRQLWDNPEDAIYDSWPATNTINDPAPERSPAPSREARE